MEGFKVIKVFRAKMVYDFEVFRSKTVDFKVSNPKYSGRRL